MFDSGRTLKKKWAGKAVSSIGKFFVYYTPSTYFFDTMLDLIRMMNWMCLWLSTESKGASLRDQV